MKKKTIGIIVAVVLIIALLAGGIAFYFMRGPVGNKEDKVYVEKVSNLIGSNGGVSNSYNGVVESQEVYEVKKDSSMTVKEMFVAVGDTVEAGDPLFSYDTTEASNAIANIRLEIEGITNDIANCNSQIEELNEERKTASQDMQFEYTSRIQTLQTQIKQDQFDQKSKEAEIAKNQKVIDSSVVKSKISGLVKTISNQEEYYDPNSSFMKILATGDYRVKAKVDEMNFYSLSEGAQVIVRSRVDENKKWTGKISVLENEPTEERNEYGMDNGQGESASKYAFYVTLDSTEDLLLGQHVFVEMDYGQTQMTEGIWLDMSWFEFDENGDAFAWVANDKMKTEKRKVSLGEMQEETGLYQVLDGITEDDMICWSMPGLYEGITCVTNYDEIDYESPLYNQDGDMMDGGMIDGDMMDGDMMDGDMIDDGMFFDETEMMDSTMEEGATE